MKIWFLPIAAALLLAGCGNAGASVASAGTDPPAVSSAPPSPKPAAPAPVTIVDKVKAVGAVVQLKGTQALIISEEFYQAANRTALVAVKTGLLPGPVLDRIQALNLVATKALQVGKAASNDTERAKAAADVMSASLELRKLGSSH